MMVLEANESCAAARPNDSLAVQLDLTLLIQIQLGHTLEQGRLSASTATFQYHYVPFVHV
jgi:hypothetical protein